MDFALLGKDFANSAFGPLSARLLSKAKKQPAGGVHAKRIGEPIHPEFRPATTLASSIWAPANQRKFPRLPEYRNHPKPRQAYGKIDFPMDDKVKLSTML